jgi:hypothetical protein
VQSIRSAQQQTKRQKNIMIRSIKTTSIGLPHPDPTGLHKAGTPTPTTLPTVPAVTASTQPKPVVETSNLKTRVEELTQQLRTSLHSSTSPDKTRLGDLFAEITQLRGAEIGELERLLAARESQLQEAREQQVQQAERADSAAQTVRIRDDGIAQMKLEQEAEVAELRTKLKSANEAYDILRGQKIEVDTDVIALRHDLEVVEAQLAAAISSRSVVVETTTTDTSAPATAVPPEEPSTLEILRVPAAAELHEGYVDAICQITYPHATKEASLPIRIDLDTARQLLRKVKGKQS